MSGISELFQQYGLTGNTIVDSIILTSIIPLVISYVTNLTSIITKVLMSLWELVIEYLSEKLRIKLFGNKISIIIIDKENALHDFLRDEIYSKNTLSECNTKTKTVLLHHAYNIIKSFKKYQYDKSYWKNRKERNPPIVPELRQTEDGNYYLDHDLQANHNKKDNDDPDFRTYGAKDASREIFTSFPLAIKKYFEQDGYTLSFKYLPHRNIIKIIVLSYTKNTNSNEENNKITTKLLDDFIVKRLNFNRATYHRLSFEIGNAKLRECFMEIINSSCAVSTMQGIIDSFYADQIINDENIFSEYQLTPTDDKRNEFDNFNDITQQTSSNGCKNSENFSSNIAVIDDTASIDSTTSELKEDHYVLNGGIINFSTNIINSHIENYKNHIKFEHRSQTIKTMTKKELLNIIGKTTMEFYGSCNTSYEQYSQGLHPKNIICNGYQMFSFNGIYVMLYNDLTKAFKSSSSHHFAPKIIASKLGKPITVKELNEIINNTILLSFKIKPFETGTAEVKTISVYKYEGRSWKQINLERRTLDTIYLPSQLLKDILSEINTFMDKKKLYDKFEIYYKKGLLFYGPPGTGKTSLVRALACHYKIPIYIININDSGINDDSIVEILNTLPGNSEYKIVLYEDIDSAFSDKEVLAVESKYNGTVVTEEVEPEKDADNKEDKDSKNNKNLTKNDYNRKYLTYSGLLNALDGILSNQKGVITIMTTNYIGKLGPALIRPGRIDKAFELSFCNHEQIVGMITHMMKIYNEFIGSVVEVAHKEYLEKKINEFASNIVSYNIKPSKLQFYVLKYIGSSDEIFNNYKQLLVKEVNE
jgi:arsenate reductase-like glutaredoxin family protein